MKKELKFGDIKSFSSIDSENWCGFKDWVGVVIDINEEKVKIRTLVNYIGTDENQIIVYYKNRLTFKRVKLKPKERKFLEKIAKEFKYQKENKVLNDYAFRMAFQENLNQLTLDFFKKLDYTDEGLLSTYFKGIKNKNSFSKRNNKNVFVIKGVFELGFDIEDYALEFKEDDTEDYYIENYDENKIIKRIKPTLFTVPKINNNMYKLSSKCMVSICFADTFFFTHQIIIEIKDKLTINRAKELAGKINELAEQQYLFMDANKIDKIRGF